MLLTSVFSNDIIVTRYATDEEVIRLPNELKIKARILECGLTISKLADLMHLSGYTLGRKIAGKTKMTLEEAFTLMDILSIPIEEFPSYFFAQRVA
jgi:plasmid maintenance system antidote protein VapI